MTETTHISWESMHIHPLDDGSDGLPLVIEPSGDATDRTLASWLEHNRDTLLGQLHERGALLFRGFDIDQPEAFERVILALDPDLKDEYLGTSPRSGLTQYVFTASELPGWYPIPQHCEMSFLPTPPQRLFFGCLVAPNNGQGGGGETPLVDFRRVLEQLDPDVRRRFEERGIRTIRNYGPPGSGRFNLWQLKPWDAMFGTTDRSVVEDKCRQEGIRFEWRSGGGLRLTGESPAVTVHPTQGTAAWFNHLQVFHIGSGPAEYKRIYRFRGGLRPWFLWRFSQTMVALKRWFGRSENHTLHCTYADGEEIPDADIEHVRDVIWDNMVVFPWKPGDVVAIDNFSVSHGRLPYKGPRQIVVSWS